MSQVDINIFRIAHTTVDHDEVARWLNTIGADRFAEDFLAQIDFEGDLKFADQIISEPAALIALAAKRCYMSFEPGLNPNVTKVRKDFVDYFDNILKSGHGCYDGETEVLTDQGWIPFVELTEENYKNYEYASLNKGGTFDYAPAQVLIQKEYNGPMWRVEGAVDLLVTPNHRMYACTTTTKEGRKKENYQIIEADQLGWQSHCQLKTALWNPTSGRLDLTPDEAAIIGFSIGDGTIKGQDKIEFHLRRDRKILWLEDITTRNGWFLHYNGDKYTVTLPRNIMHYLHFMYDENREKVIPPGLITTHQVDVCKGLFLGLIESDGSRGETDISFHTTSDTLGDQFQQLCLHIGLAANRVKTYTQAERGLFGEKPLTTWHVVRRNLKPEVNKYDEHKTRMYRVDEWQGTVHCIELEQANNRLGVLYVRRNGIPIWCGNSVLEHATYSFAIEGVSRVFTAEMNRHRAGWAISEGSLRFIRFDKDIPYWVPTSLQGPDVIVNETGSVLLGPDTIKQKIASLPEEEQLDYRKHFSRIIFKEVFTQIEYRYSQLLAAWEMDESSKSFHYKKTVTSALRRIVPLGVATGGVWTGNVRALRHVLAMRCSPAAEEEICHVFARIASEIVEREPLLFGDFSKDSGFWAPKYPKV